MDEKKPYELLYSSDSYFAAIKCRLEKLSQLYYTQPILSGEEQFASYPGILQFSRISQGKTKVFKIPGLGVRQEKKLIVISDWSLVGHGSDSLFFAAVHDLMVALISLGFDIQLVLEGTILKISELRNIEAALRFAAPICNEDLLKLLNATGTYLSADQVLNMDYFQTRCMVEQLQLMDLDRFFEREASPLIPLPSTYLSSTLDADAHHPIFNLADLLYTYESDPHFSDPRFFLNNAAPFSLYIPCQLEDAIANQLLQKFFSSSEKIKRVFVARFCYRDIRLPQAMLNKLHPNSLHFYAMISRDESPYNRNTTSLASAPEPWMHSLRQKRFYGNLEVFSPSSEQHVHTLSLFVDSFSDAISKLRQVNALECLSLTINTDEESLISEWEMLVFPALKTLSIEFSRSANKICSWIEPLLKSAPNLEFFRIWRGSHPVNFSLTDRNNLPSPRYVEFDILIDEGQAVDLLYLARAAKELLLPKIAAGEPDLRPLPSDLQFSCLEKLTTSSACSLNARTLILYQKVLARATTVSELIWNYGDISAESIDLMNELDFSHIKVVRILHRYYKKKVLKTLLENTPFLEELYLAEIPSDSSETNAIISLPEIRKIVVLNSNNNEVPTYFVECFRNSPKLKTLVNIDHAFFHLLRNNSSAQILKLSEGICSRPILNLEPAFYKHPEHYQHEVLSIQHGLTTSFFKRLTLHPVASSLLLLQSLIHRNNSFKTIELIPSYSSEETNLALNIVTTLLSRSPIFPHATTFHTNANLSRIDQYYFLAWNMLYQMPQLAALSLMKAFLCRSNPASMSLHSLPFLTKLFLTDCVFDRDWLLQFRAHAKNLKTIRYYDSDDSDVTVEQHRTEILGTERVLLSDLEHIDITINSHKDSFRSQIILSLHQPLLKTLSINYRSGQQLESLFDKESAPYFPQLESLRVERTGAASLLLPLTMSLLAKIIRSAPKLKTIKIDPETYSRLTKLHKAVPTEIPYKYLIKEAIPELSSNPTSSSRPSSSSSRGYPETTSYRSAPRTLLTGEQTHRFTEEFPTLQAVEYFYPSDLPVNHYRLEVHLDAIFGHGNNEFYTNTNDDDIVIIDVPRSQTPIKQYYFDTDQEQLGHYLADRSIQLSTQWSPLPSRTIAEEILLIYAEKVEYEVGYSHKKNLFQIRLTSASAQATPLLVSVQFILKPIALQPIPISEIPAEVLDIINHCKNFSKKPFTLDLYKTIQEHWDARYQQQVGACGVRSWIAWDKIKKTAAYRQKQCNIRVTTNDCHAFIELFIPLYGWRFWELGGYSVELQVKPMELPVKISAAEKLFRQLRHRITAESSVTSSLASSVPSHSQASSLRDLARPLEQPSINIPPEFLSDLQTPSQPPELTETISTLLTTGTQNLVYVQQPDDALAVIALIAQQECRPYFYVDTADDLQWQTNGLRFSSDPTTMDLVIEEKFNDLRYFMERHAEDGILFINFSQFSEKDIASLRKIIETPRYLEGELFSDRIPIVVFYCPSQRSSQQVQKLEIFFHHVMTWQTELTQDLYNHRYQPLDASDTTPLETIDLFESDDWQHFLFGAIHKTETALCLAPSSLLQSYVPEVFHIKNPPSHNRSFNLFLQRALQLDEFDLYGRTFHLSENFTIRFSTGYHLAYDHWLLASEESPVPTYPLNSNTFTDFLPHITYQGESIVSVPGFIALEPYLTFYLTESLPIQFWAQLIAQARLFSPQLSIKMTTNVSLPDEMSQVPREVIATIPKSFSSMSPMSTAEPCVIIQGKTEELPSITHYYEDQYPQAMSLMLIPEVHDYSDLFYNLLFQLTKVRILCQKVESDPLLALKRGEIVIVTGTLSLILIQALSYVLLSTRERTLDPSLQFSGQLILITDSNVDFSSNLYQLDSTSFQQLSALKAASSTAYIPLPIASSSDFSPLSLENLEHYKQSSFLSLYNGLQKSPIVFYHGATGVGKSTYLLTQFSKDYQAHTHRPLKCYFGFSQLLDFAQHSDPNTDPIFIDDEANLSKEKLDILKGLKSKTPHLWFNGRCYFISGRCILVGNQASAGGVRQQHEFIDQHAYFVKRKKPNDAYLYHEIIKPLWMDQDFSESIEFLASIMLFIYKEINKINPAKKHRLTARHLNIISLLFLEYRRQFADKDILLAHLMIAACLSVSENCISSEEESRLLVMLKNQYDYNPNCFNLLQTLFIETTLPQHLPGFILTPSRYRSMHLLLCFINLSNHPKFQMGISLEGEHGEGKSSLPVALFEHLNIPFAVFSFGKNPEADRERLLTLFHQGYKVIFDEFDVGVAIHEKLINHLSMGVDENEQPAACPGFMLVSTQNGVNKEGREALSEAIQARFVCIQVPNYPEAEQRQLLLAQGMSSIRVDELLAAAQAANKIRKERGMAPLTYRHLQKVATRELLVNKVSYEPIVIPSHLLEKIEQKIKKLEDTIAQRDKSFSLFTSSNDLRHKAAALRQLIVLSQKGTLSSESIHRVEQAYPLLYKELFSKDTRELIVEVKKLTGFTR